MQHRQVCCSRLNCGIFSSSFGGAAAYALRPCTATDVHECHAGQHGMPLIMPCATPSRPRCRLPCVCPAWSWVAWWAAWLQAS